MTTGRGHAPDGGDAPRGPVALPRAEVEAREAALAQALKRARAQQKRSPGPEADAALEPLMQKRQRYKLHLERQRNVTLLGDPALLELLPAHVTPVLRAIRAPFFYSVWLHAERERAGVALSLGVNGSTCVAWADDEADALDFARMPPHHAWHKSVAASLDLAVAEAVAAVNASFASAGRDS